MRKLASITFVLLMCSMHLFAQERTVTGTVTDEKDGSPLQGVSVTVKGTNTGTTTGTDGAFRLSVPAGSKSLVFSFVNYESIEMTIGNKTSFKVSLTTTEKSLQEVVVVAYGTQKKSDQTGSLTTLKTKDIENIPFTSVDKGLQGKVAGLQSVATTGAPGSGQTVILRGVGSINASTAPLYVIDGVPINSGDLTRLSITSNALAGLNPNDVESVTVLKDAASTSIYGSRAANGVILITTRKGRSGKTRLRFDTEMGFSNVAFFNQSAHPVNNAGMRELLVEGLMNRYGYTQAQAGTVSDANFYTASGVDTDWLGLVLRQGKQTQHNISIEGGNDKTTFFLSGGYFNQEGVVITSDFKRYNGSINATHKINDKMKIAFRMPASFTRIENPNAGGAFRNPVLSAYFNLPGKNPYNADGTVKITGEFAPGSGIFNPLAVAQYSYRNGRTVQARPSVDYSYNIIKGLNFTSRYGIDYNMLEENQFDSKKHGDGAGTNGRAFAYDTRYFNWTFSNFLDYSKTWFKSGDLTTSAKLGYEAQKSSGYFVSVWSQDFPPTDVLTLPSVAGTPRLASADRSDYTFNSVFSSLRLNYQNRFVVDGSFRRDGSSRFGVNNRYGNFWSVGGTWNVDKEAFLQKISWISQAKLRASYGVNGNAGIGNYIAQGTYGFGANYDQLNGSFPSNPGNPNLTWELNKPMNIGVDLGLFKNRLNLTVDLYKRITTDLLLNEPLSQTTGFTSILRNVGSMENKGIEVTVVAVPVKFKNFQWDVNFNIAFNENKITKLADGQNEIINGVYIYRVGKNFSSFYTRSWAGVDPANGDPLWYKDSKKNSTTNNYNTAERDIVGQSNPKFFGGLSNTFSYKGFSLDAELYYSYGSMLRDSWAFYYQGDGGGAGFGKLKSQLTRWKKPGDIAPNPKNIYGGNLSSSAFSSRFLYDGSYMRLRNLQLSYNFPSEVIKKLKMSNLNFYVRGTNLFTWVKDKNLTFDPEQGLGNTTNLDVYIPKTMTLGVNVTF